MLICMLLGGTLDSVDELNPTPGMGITDENVTESAPFVRALVVSRLEQAWRAVDPHIQVQRNEETGLIMRPDPRFLEAGIRIIDRLANLYRLDRPQMSNRDQDSRSREALVDETRSQIEAMETRLRGQENS